MDKDNIAQMMHDKWFDDYRNKEKSSFEEYTKILTDNNSLVEHINRGDNCIGNRLYDEAIKELDLGIDIGEKLLLNGNLIDESSLAKGYLNRGIAYQYLKKCDKALNDKTKSVEILERIYSEGNLNDENDLALAYMNRGQTYGAMGQYDIDIIDTNKSIRIWEQMKKEGKMVDENILVMAYANKSSTEAKAGLSQNTELDELDVILSNMNNSIKMLKKIGSNGEKDLASTYTMRGLLNFQYDRFSEAVSDFDESIKISESISNSGGQFDINDYAKAHAGKGLSYQVLGDTDIAIPNLKKGIELWKQLQSEGKQVDDNLLYLSQTILATFINNTFGDIDEAMSYNLNAMEIANRLGMDEGDIDLKGLATNHMILGVSCDQKEEFTEANVHYSACIEIWEKLCVAGEDIDINNMALAYMNRGSNYYSMCIIDKAISDYSKAIEIMECIKKGNEIQDDFDLFMAYINRSQAYEADDNFQEAINDSITAMHILKSMFTSNLDSQTLYYKVLGELIELIVRENNGTLMQKVFQDFLYSMQQVPKIQEAETAQNNLLRVWR